MNIPFPSRGDDILHWARSITTGVNELAPIGGRGTLVKEGVNGFGFGGLPENKRQKIAVTKDNSCYAIDSFKIVDDSEEEQELLQLKITFKNPYFRVGGTFYLAETSEITITLGDDESDTSEDGSYILALVIDLSGTAPSDEIKVFGDVAHIIREQADGKSYIIPLYKINQNGVLIDFRNAPLCDAGEFSEPTDEEEGNGDDENQ